MNSPEINYLKNWLLKAGNDMKAARQMIESSDPVTDVACFHCQQAVEKYLKAYLIYQNKEFEKNHNLFSLQNYCAELDHDFSGIDLKNLNFFGVAVRYPDEFYIPSLEEAKEYYAIALKIKQLAEEKIKIQ